MFGVKRKNTGEIARERLKMLVNAERIDCSPQVLVMMKKDLMKTIGKYILIEEDGVSLNFLAVPPRLTATIRLGKAMQKERNQIR